MEELSGCWREAARADAVAIELLKIRTHLTSSPTPLISSSSPHPHSPSLSHPDPPSIPDHEIITAILRHVEQSSRLLRDLHDLFPIYRLRVPVVVYYLTVILPCLQKTLRDMLAFLLCDDWSIRMKWMLMHERLNEQGGMSLALRFVMYVDFLVQCVRLLSRSPTYDPTTLELLRLRILRLRALRGIPAPPIPVQPHLAPAQPNLMDIERRHWAEKIFDDHAQPLSQTLLKHRRESRCWGPSMNLMKLGIPPQSKVLFKLPFDKNHLSVTLYLDDTALHQSPHLLCRWMDKQNNPHYSSFGVHELCIRGYGSALCFKRWSEYKEHPTVWMALFFKTWQRLVLFHCSFVALKARSQLTNLIPRDDYIIAGEVKIFQGQIVDDGFHHSLFVYENQQTHTLRLHAAVANGELRKCPIWTAFITDFQVSSDTWLARHSRHRVWIQDLHLYVFCDEYSRRAQVRKHGEFELYFVHGAAADAFIRIFYPLDSDSESERAIEDLSRPASAGLQ
ncbi:hypothetical protein BCIN_11g05250 [Botrytis cinerea B05.10]|uniref:Uncharacterized protein n=1 Tax=Botryotinia fuckeliana (strain B05.10) TaxID=332648 RepID=A0A384JXB1_BOTFB|nr:hypothetical protein BCIN_11g05250 [Botrytis cinerea B05.10]ATZ55249.1 hypothetical protein BCIN_11g05250 [Botrytis cinerea B05.10]